ncbi:hypothetical protein GH714_006472 [Hevea brasiliensis]|uniref:Cytochrome P450 n=1 Tax=Hevea brasiliensis TaxID=3981 RepID=A0A6A6M8L5_HEVBR|nr:hypothetical protein GH714_006472 [Hevea brasiliensis]
MLESISKLADDSKPVNLTEAMMALTISAICRVAFGKGFEEGGKEAKRFHALLNETQAMFVGFFFSNYIPYIGWVVDKLCGLISRLEKNFHEFDVFYQKLIDEHLDLKREKPEYENILDVALQICKDRSSKVQRTYEHIKAILMTQVHAAVIWAMSFLMKNPETMKEVQEEIRSLIGKKVYVNAWAIGRDPEAWENPLEFCPERFLDSYIDMKGQDYELIPFGAGRRICPGIFIGIANMDLSLANLLYKFDWEMPAEMTREDIDTDNVLPGIAVHQREHLRLMAKKYI